MDLQVLSVIDVIDNEVVNNIDLNLLNDPLVGILWNSWSEEIGDYDEVVILLTSLGYYTKNSFKLHHNLKNCESPTAKRCIIKPP